MNPFLGTQFMGKGVQNQYARTLATGDSRTTAGRMIGASANKATGKGGWSAGVANMAYDNPAAAGQAVSGLAGVADALFGKANVVKDKNGNSMGEDMYGRPVMHTQSYQSSIDQLGRDAKGEVGKSVGQGTAAGASTGAAIGSMIMPGIGTLIGGGIGAIGGATAGLIGGKSRQKKMKKEIANREGLLNESMMRLNEDNKDYFEKDMASDINRFKMSQRAMRVGR